MAQNVLQYSLNDIRSDAGMDEPRTENVPLSSSERGISRIEVRKDVALNGAQPQGSLPAMTPLTRLAVEVAGTAGGGEADLTWNPVTSQGTAVAIGMGEAARSMNPVPPAGTTLAAGMGEALLGSMTSNQFIEQMLERLGRSRAGEQEPRLEAAARRIQHLQKVYRMHKTYSSPPRGGIVPLPFPGQTSSSRSPPRTVSSILGPSPPLPLAQLAALLHSTSQGAGTPASPAPVGSASIPSVPSAPLQSPFTSSASGLRPTLGPYHLPSAGVPTRPAANHSSAAQNSTAPNQAWGSDLHIGGLATVPTKSLEAPGLQRSAQALAGPSLQHGPAQAGGDQRTIPLRPWEPVAPAPSARGPRGAAAHQDGPRTNIGARMAAETPTRAAPPSSGPYSPAPPPSLPEQATASIGSADSTTPSTHDRGLGTQRPAPVEHATLAPGQEPGRWAAGPGTQAPPAVEQATLGARHGPGGPPGRRPSATPVLGDPHRGCQREPWGGEPDGEVAEAAGSGSAGASADAVERDVERESGGYGAPAQDLEKGHGRGRGGGASAGERGGVSARLLQKIAELQSLGMPPCLKPERGADAEQGTCDAGELQRERSGLSGRLLQKLAELQSLDVPSSQGPDGLGPEREAGGGLRCEKSGLSTQILQTMAELQRLEIPSCLRADSTEWTVAEAVREWEALTQLSSAASRAAGTSGGPPSPGAGSARSLSGRSSGSSGGLPSPDQAPVPGAPLPAAAREDPRQPGPLNAGLLGTGHVLSRDSPTPNFAGGLPRDTLDPAGQGAPLHGSAVGDAEARGPHGPQGLRAYPVAPSPFATPSQVGPGGNPHSGASYHGAPPMGSDPHQLRATGRGGAVAAGKPLGPAEGVPTPQAAAWADGPTPHTASGNINSHAHKEREPLGGLVTVPRGHSEGDPSVTPLALGHRPHEKPSVGPNDADGDHRAPQGPAWGLPSASDSGLHSARAGAPWGLPECGAPRDPTGELQAASHSPPTCGAGEGPARVAGGSALQQPSTEPSEPLREPNPVPVGSGSFRDPGCAVELSREPNDGCCAAEGDTTSLGMASQPSWELHGGVPTVEASGPSWSHKELGSSGPQHGSPKAQECPCGSPRRTHIPAGFQPPAAPEHPEGTRIPHPTTGYHQGPSSMTSEVSGPVARAAAGPDPLTQDMEEAKASPVADFGACTEGHAFAGSLDGPTANRGRPGISKAPHRHGDSPQSSPAEPRAVPEQGHLPKGPDAASPGPLGVLLANGEGLGSRAIWTIAAVRPEDGADGPWGPGRSARGPPPLSVEPVDLVWAFVELGLAAALVVSQGISFCVPQSERPMQMCSALATRLVHAALRVAAFISATAQVAVEHSKPLVTIPLRAPTSVAHWASAVLLGS
eukprot:jgi/Botrbrau1/12674/Bobra.67_1s0038.1